VHVCRTYLLALRVFSDACRCMLTENAVQSRLSARVSDYKAPPMTFKVSHVACDGCEQGVTYVRRTAFHRWKFKRSNNQACVSRLHADELLMDQ
jgi:hypothetical protein